MARANGLNLKDGVDGDKADSSVKKAPNEKLADIKECIEESELYVSSAKQYICSSKKVLQNLRGFISFAHVNIGIAEEFLVESETRIKRLKHELNSTLQTTVPSTYSSVGTSTEYIRIPPFTSSRIGTLDNLDTTKEQINDSAINLDNYDAVSCERHEGVTVLVLEQKSKFQSKGSLVGTDVHNSKDSLDTRSGTLDCDLDSLELSNSPQVSNESKNDEDNRDLGTLGKEHSGTNIMKNSGKRTLWNTDSDENNQYLEILENEHSDTSILKNSEKKTLWDSDEDNKDLEILGKESSKTRKILGLRFTRDESRNFQENGSNENLQCCNSKVETNKLNLDLKESIVESNKVVNWNIDPQNCATSSPKVQGFDQFRNYVRKYMGDNKDTLDQSKDQNINSMNAKLIKMSSREDLVPNDTTDSRDKFRDSICHSDNGAINSHIMKHTKTLAGKSNTEASLERCIGWLQGIKNEELLRNYNLDLQFILNYEPYQESSTENECSIHNSIISEIKAIIERLVASYNEIQIPSHDFDDKNAPSLNKFKLNFNKTPSKDIEHVIGNNFSNTTCTTEDKIVNISTISSDGSTDKCDSKLCSEYLENKRRLTICLSSDSSDASPPKQLSNTSFNEKICHDESSAEEFQSENLNRSHSSNSMDEIFIVLSSDETPDASLNVTSDTSFHVNRTNQIADLDTINQSVTEDTTDTSVYDNSSDTSNSDIPISSDTSLNVESSEASEAEDSEESLDMSLTSIDEDVYSFQRSDTSHAGDASIGGDVSSCHFSTDASVNEDFTLSLSEEFSNISISEDSSNLSLNDDLSYISFKKGVSSSSLDNSNKSSNERTRKTELNVKYRSEVNKMLVLETSYGVVKDAFKHYSSKLKSPQNDECDISESVETIEIPSESSVFCITSTNTVAKRGNGTDSSKSMVITNSSRTYILDATSTNSSSAVNGADSSSAVSGADSSGAVSGADLQITPLIPPIEMTNTES